MGTSRLGDRGRAGRRTGRRVGVVDAVDDQSLGVPGGLDLTSRGTSRKEAEIRSRPAAA